MFELVMGAIALLIIAMWLFAGDKPPKPPKRKRKH